MTNQHEHCPHGPELLTLSGLRPGPSPYPGNRIDHHINWILFVLTSTSIFIITDPVLLAGTFLLATTSLIYSAILITGISVNVCPLHKSASRYTAPLRHVNFEVACLDKPSKPRCRQASYEPGMRC